MIYSGMHGDIIIIQGSLTVIGGRVSTMPIYYQTDGNTLKVLTMLGECFGNIGVARVQR